jgi:hypothetical protein
MINWKDFPITDMQDYESITCDVIKFTDNLYQAQLAFWHDISDEENEGFVMITGIVAESIEEIYELLDIVIQTGFFDGCEIKGEGTLFDTNGNMLDSIDWNQYSEQDTEQVRILH